jgi:hypothetical protein
MKKLMMTLAAALSATALMAEVTSQVVGFMTEESNGGYRSLSVKFQAIGANGGEFNITNIIDGTTVAQYSDFLQVYDPNLGFINYVWNGSAWVDDVNFAPVSLNVVPGNGFLMQAAASWKQLGEVASTTTYVHAIPLSTFVFVGNAFPAAQTLANFDWSEVVQYTDFLQLYDPNLGFINYVWNGSAWVDDLNFAPIPISTAAEGFLFMSYTVASLTQRLSPPYYAE